jgi:hypothetical protein
MKTITKKNQEIQKIKIQEAETKERYRLMRIWAEAYIWPFLKAPLSLEAVKARYPAIDVKDKWEGNAGERFFNYEDNVLGNVDIYLDLKIKLAMRVSLQMKLEDPIPQIVFRVFKSEWRYQSHPKPYMRLILDDMQPNEDICGQMDDLSHAALDYFDQTIMKEESREDFWGGFEEKLLSILPSASIKF